MQLAYLDARELVFEQYRRELARESMAPSVKASFLQVSAEGLRTFGRITEAQRAAERMLDIASSHELHEHVMSAAALLDELERPAVLVPEPARAPSPRVARIARTMAEMRAAAGLPD
jgi:hypothetical protein